jgi:hypothetical protein
MGLRDLPDFEHDIPAGRTADERTLIHGIVFLFQCREGWAPDNAVPLDRTFLSAWTGLSVYRVRLALAGLKERGVLEHQGQTLGLVKTGLWLLMTMVRRTISSMAYLAETALLELGCCHTHTALGRSPLAGTPRMTFEKALQKLKKVKRRGRQAYACCPAHHDHNPSLSIREADVPRIGFVVYCHAGCDWRDVVAGIQEAGDRA